MPWIMNWKKHTRKSISIRNIGYHLRIVCWMQKTGEMHEHKPEYCCINQIPWDYEPNKEYSGIETEKFFKSAMSAEDRKTILQVSGAMHDSM